MKKVCFMLAMMVCIFASCSDGGGEEPSTPTPKPEEVKTEITIDSGIISNGLSFDSTGGEQSVSFSVNADWTLSIASTTSGATWCKASVTSGSKGTTNVKFTVSENTDYEDRSVSVTIKARTVSKTFTITQKGADAMLVTTTKYEVAQEGGQIEIEVKANIDYRMEISEEAKEWIKESSGRALTTYKHKLDIAMNEDAKKREGEITFKSGNKVETVKVYQAGGAILLLSQNEYTVSDAGETISVDIKSNIDFGVQMPNVDWIIDEASSRGLSSHTLKYVIKANEGYDSRSADIVFYDKNSDLKDTLKIIQAQKNAILLEQRNIKVDSNGKEIEIKVKANIEFEIQMPNDTWIKKTSSSRGLNEQLIYFNVDKNTNENERQSSIVFANRMNNISDTLIVTQEGYKKIVTLEKAGLLRKEICDNAMNIISLKIVGPINGDDIFYLRRMLGATEYNKKDRGKLTHLDLLEALIVEGGEWYYSYKEDKYYTVDNVISENMFYHCYNLKKIILPKRTKSIGKNAFRNCSYLEDVVIPENITSIGDYAFDCCYYLKSINIPNSVVTLGKGVFSNCHAANKIVIGRGVTSIENGTFHACKKVKELMIPDNVKSIGSYAFNGCESLLKVTIGNGVKRIESNAFKECSLLKTVIIGENIETILHEAFYNSPITEFWSYSSVPPIIKDEQWWEEYPFNKITLKIDAILYVPIGSKNVYQKSDWGIFFRNIEEIE